MKKIHYLCKRLLRLILSCYIFKCNTCLLLYIYLSVILADTHAAHHTAAFGYSSIYKGKYYIYE